MAVAGQFDPADQTLDADEVAIVSDTGFYAGGLVTYVTPTTGAATDMQFYVRHVLPSGLSEVPLGGHCQREHHRAMKTTASTGCTMLSPTFSLTMRR